MENGLINWYNQKKKKNLFVTSGDIRRRAMELSKRDDFTASKTWFKKFKDRNKIEVTRPRKAQKQSSKKDNKI